jgi:hypothetical protein
MRNGILPIWKFNQIQERKHSEAVREWSSGDRRGGYPCKSCYMFMTKQHYIQRRGYVVVNDGSHRYFKTKREAVAFVENNS